MTEGFSPDVPSPRGASLVHFIQCTSGPKGPFILDSLSAALPAPDPVEFFRSTQPPAVSLTPRQTLSRLRRYMYHWRDRENPSARSARNSDPAKPPVSDFSFIAWFR